MGVPPSNLPPGRRALVALQDRIERLSSDMEKLKAGKTRLADQMELVDSAKHELESLIAQDSFTLIDRIKNSVDFALSGFGGHRAVKIAESLAASQLQHSVGAKAAAEIDSQIERLESEIAEARGLKDAAIRNVLIEASAGGLDRVTAKSTGEWEPNRRVVVTIPSVGGVPEQVVAAPASTLERAKNIWRDFAAELDADPLATVESLQFPHVHGTEDSATTVYADYSRAERHQIDLEHALGTK
jgi:hypothetical protein